MESVLVWVDYGVKVGWEPQEKDRFMYAAFVRTGHLARREVIARAALAFLIAVIPSSIHASTSSPPASGRPDGGAVILAIGNWPDPM